MTKVPYTLTLRTFSNDYLISSLISTLDTHVNTVKQLVRPRSSWRDCSAMNTSSQAAFGDDLKCFLNSASAGCFVGDVDPQVERSSTVECLSYTIALLYGYYVEDLSYEGSPSHLDLAIEQRTTTVPPLAMMARATSPPILPVPPVTMYAELVSGTVL